MDSYAAERTVAWSKRGEVYEFRFDKHGQTYIWRCTGALRRECQRAVILDAGNRELNLSHVDAVFILDRIRNVIPPERGDGLEDEAVVEETNVRWLGWVFIVTCATWAWLVALILRA